MKGLYLFCKPNNYRIAQGQLSKHNRRNTVTALQILVKSQTKRPQTKGTKTLKFPEKIAQGKFLLRKATTCMAAACNFNSCKVSLFWLCFPLLIDVTGFTFCVISEMQQERDEVIAQIAVSILCLELMEDLKWPCLSQRPVALQLLLLRVTSSNPRVTISNLRVMSSNPRVTSSNPRVKRLKHELQD